jgi:sigma-B regulation protein RsbU (phosphoserine phosphatase)
MATAMTDGRTSPARVDGANDYVTKPLDFPVVPARVRTQRELKRSVDRIPSPERSLEHRNAELDRDQRMRKERDLAARMQRALLPAHLPVMNEARFAWAYHPCEELAGDILNIFPIGARQVGMYLLDVSGHGVPAALLSVTLSRLMAPSSVAGEGSPVVRAVRQDRRGRCPQPSGSRS